MSYYKETKFIKDNYSSLNSVGQHSWTPSYKPIKSKKVSVAKLDNREYMFGHFVPESAIDCRPTIPTQPSLRKTRSVKPLFMKSPPRSKHRKVFNKVGGKVNNYITLNNINIFYPNKKKSPARSRPTQEYFEKDSISDNRVKTPIKQRRPMTSTGNVRSV